MSSQYTNFDDDQYSEVESDDDVTLPNHKCLSISPELTRQMLFYIVIFHAGGNFLICLIVNWIINYLMNINNPSEYIDLWAFPVGGVTTLLGTTFIQGTLCFLIGGAVTIKDVLKFGKMSPPLAVKAAPRPLRLFLHKHPRLFFGSCCYSRGDFLAAVGYALLFGLSNVIFLFVPLALMICLFTFGFSFSSHIIIHNTWLIYISFFSGIIGFLVELIVCYVGLLVSAQSVTRYRSMIRNYGEIKCVTKGDLNSSSSFSRSHEEQRLM